LRAEPKEREKRMVTKRGRNHRQGGGGLVFHTLSRTVEVAAEKELRSRDIELLASRNAGINGDGLTLKVTRDKIRLAKVEELLR